MAQMLQKLKVSRRRRLEKIALESIARQLRLQLEEIEARLNKCEGAFSAIRRIPNEIVGEIFAFALETPSPLNKAGREALVNFGLVELGAMQPSSRTGCGPASPFSYITFRDRTTKSRPRPSIL
ncbi:hypothetical protein DFP72DRAFT_1079425 [Ephemerocybe angulata]|uniref:Uncharacterized protein n=1 Tax=Ephemerocybe angulata TaxID=980116 RepID=A0A8H6HD10_9AGAR|nr:hypothetical protein DFP72DRAFT_1079425 [Tulosesus angulatus]